MCKANDNKQVLNSLERSLPVKIKSWFLSLIFPLISIAASITLSIIGVSIYTIVFGLFLGGVVPLLIVSIKKVDISRFFVGKIIISLTLIAGAILSWTLFFGWLSDGIYRILVLPVAALITELIFAATRDAAVKQKVCLFLSGLTPVYFGVALDILCLFSS